MFAVRQCNLNNLRDNKKFEEELILEEGGFRVSEFQSFRISGFQNQKGYPIATTKAKSFLKL